MEEEITEKIYSVWSANQRTQVTLGNFLVL